MTLGAAVEAVVAVAVVTVVVPPGTAGRVGP
jgi:hypothetical protein